MQPEEIELENFYHVTPVQLRFNDVDILGHINNTVYFSLYDLAKARYMETILNGDLDWRDVDSVIANVNCSYFKQIKFGEEVEVKTRCVHLGERSFTLRQCLVEVHTQEIRSVCDTVMVSFDAATSRSAPMRPALRKAIEDFESAPH